MQLIILVSNLKEISHSVFSWKKNQLRCNSTVKIRFGQKKILDYAYVLKNGVGRYNIFFFIFTQSLLNPPFCVVFVQNPSMFWFVPCAFSSTNNFSHAEALYRMRSLCRSYECMNIVRVSIGVLTGLEKIKQRRISFVIGYLRMIL